VPGVWKRTVVLRRVWCVFELVQAHLSNFQVHLALNPAQRIVFLRFLEQIGSHKDFTDAIGLIKLSNCSSTHEGDFNWLSEELNRSPGSADIEHSIFCVMRAWLLVQLRQQLRSSTANSPTASKWMILIGELLADSGETDTAAAMYQAALPLLQSSCGSTHARTIGCCWELAKLLVKLERYAESTPLLTLCLDTKKALLGASHESVLTLQHTLGSVLMAQRDYARAETCFVISLTSLRDTHGENDFRTAAAAAALADLYSKTGKLAQAAKLYRLFYDV
jgi:tetratricopeptide (TPR) repeat protein